MTSENIFAAICILTVLIMMIYYIKRERKLLSFLFGAVTGTAALILLNKYGAFIGIDVPLNIFNVSGSAVLGVPFVICLVILQRI
ncbi:MAG: pro-sigmaK processing inhibitor BofA family protein [Ruminococcus sp.]